jgi:lysyl-tRNA synthetase class 2
MRSYPEPEEFYQALERGLPESSGCAIGVDRLAMLVCDTNDISDVRFG